jgi:hypothetical protein
LTEIDQQSLEPFAVLSQRRPPVLFDHLGSHECPQKLAAEAVEPIPDDDVAVLGPVILERQHSQLSRTANA